MNHVGKLGLSLGERKRRCIYPSWRKKNTTGFIILSVLKEPHCCIVGEHNMHKIDFNASKKNRFTNKLVSERKETLNEVK